MTPEERLQKIENSLRHSSELHAQHVERFARTDTAIEKNASAIRDLIKVSRIMVGSHRSLADSHRVLDEKLAALAVLHDALMQAQLETEHKLQRWIDRQGS